MTCGKVEVEVYGVGMISVKKDFRSASLGLQSAPAPPLTQLVLLLQEDTITSHLLPWEWL